MAGPVSLCCCITDGGFKLVTSQVAWFGRLGFAECADQSDSLTCLSGFIPYSPNPPDHKYLGMHIEISWQQTFHRDVAYPAECIQDSSFSDDSNFSFHSSFESHIDRYSGITTATSLERWNETTNGVTTEVEGAEAAALFLANIPPYTAVDAECSHLNPAVPNPASGYSIVTAEGDDNNIFIACERNEVLHGTPPCTNVIGTGTDDTTVVGTFTIEVSLFDKFTNTEVYDLAKGLLAMWNLGDDTHYPWRTSCGGESYHLGALVTFNYGVDGSIIGGPYAGETWHSGAHALTGYAVDGISGGSALYLAAPADVGYTIFPARILILGKWAEKKVTLPSHNYARPCGATDSAALDADLNPCWPGTPDPCTGACNSTVSTGDYTVLEYTYNYRLLGEGNRFNAQNDLYAGSGPPCELADVSVPVLWTATCSQGNAATGTVLYVSPNPESFSGPSQGYTFPSGVTCDDSYGFQWLRHIRQAMPDPLFTCAGLYADPSDVLMEESRCASPGGCPGLPAGSYFNCLSISNLGTCGLQDSYGMQCPPL